MHTRSTCRTGTDHASQRCKLHPRAVPARERLLGKGSQSDCCPHRNMSEENFDAVVAAIAVCLHELRRMVRAVVHPDRGSSSSSSSSGSGSGPSTVGSAATVSSPTSGSPPSTAVAVAADLDELHRSVEDTRRWIDDVKKRLGRRGGVTVQAQLDRFALEAQSLARTIEEKRKSDRRRRASLAASTDSDEDVASYCSDGDHHVSRRDRQAAVMAQADADAATLMTAKQTHEDVVALHRDLLALKDVSADILALSYVRTRIEPRKADDRDCGARCRCFLSSF